MRVRIGGAEWLPPSRVERWLHQVRLTYQLVVVDGARGSSRSAPTSLGPRATALLDESDDMVQTILILDESDVVYASD